MRFSYYKRFYWKAWPWRPLKVMKIGFKHFPRLELYLDQRSAKEVQTVPLLTRFFNPFFVWWCRCMVFPFCVHTHIFSSKSVVDMTCLGSRAVLVTLLLVLAATIAKWVENQQLVCVIKFWDYFQAKKICIFVPWKPLRDPMFKKSVLQLQIHYCNCLFPRRRSVLQ